MNDLNFSLPRSVGSLEKLGMALAEVLQKAKAPAVVEALSISTLAAAHADVVGPLLDPITARAVAVKLRMAADSYEAGATATDKPMTH